MNWKAAVWCASLATVAGLIYYAASRLLWASQVSSFDFAAGLTIGSFITALFFVPREAPQCRRW